MVILKRVITNNWIKFAGLKDEVQNKDVSFWSLNLRSGSYEGCDASISQNTMAISSKKQNKHKYSAAQA